MDADKEKDPNKDKHPPVLEEDNKTQQSASLDVAVDEAQVAENEENRAIEKKRKKTKQAKELSPQKSLIELLKKELTLRTEICKYFSAVVVCNDCYF